MDTPYYKGTRPKIHPKVLELVNVILKQEKFDPEVDQYELRQSRQPDESNPSGSVTYTNLFINGHFVCRVDPMTDDLKKSLNERYSLMGDSPMVVATKIQRKRVSAIIQSLTGALHNPLLEYPVSKALDHLIESRYWFGKDIQRNGGAYPYKQGNDPTTTKFEPEVDVDTDVSLYIWKADQDSYIQGLKIHRNDLQTVLNEESTGYETDKAYEHIQLARHWLGHAIGGAHAYWLLKTIEIPEGTLTDEMKKEFTAPSPDLVQGSTKDGKRE